MAVAAPPELEHAPPDLPPDVPDEPWDGDDGPNDDEPRHGRWVTLATFMHPAEAHIARLRLESAGVPCVLLDELMAGTQCLSLAVGGVKLQVLEQDRLRAARLLTRMMPHLAPPEPPLVESDRRESSVQAACVVEAAGIVCRLRETNGQWRLDVDADHFARAAGVLGRTRLARLLSPAAVSSLRWQTCPNCGGTRSRPDWSLFRLRPLASDLRAGLTRLLARRRCRHCGHRW
jgi:hypothetical protein